MTDLRRKLIAVGSALRELIPALPIERANAVQAQLNELDNIADSAGAAVPTAWAPAVADDIAVDAFAAAMKRKLDAARAKGRNGWERCSQEELSRMLRNHVEKGDPRDVANFCAFLWNLGFGIAPPPATAQDHRSSVPLAADRIDPDVSPPTAQAAARGPLTEAVREALGELMSIESAQWPQISRAITILEGAL